ncbi:hypothetical protein KIH39_06080 [Telmatocola sphagniphila]|uniref:1,4-dihydroxy-6-naphtoate synthase n=1 Tax=Telmatocola sphagniphila TaxID=1123043 RepID=A0A8E6EZH3_9BACT|nr:MqnA/MqnD/SBP family protein [Telmatocola sphagniphila]QVL33476.1 hypothetical protein KIH39_06080 [Telmatocola sphagniphila]
MKTLKTLTIAYTPDSDDAFYYDALETGLIPLPGFRPHFFTENMSCLNQKALQGVYDVTAISSVIYPQISREYAILNVGTSVGRGYGPVLVSREFSKMENLNGKRVGVPGIPTTGWFLLKCFCPDALMIEMQFDEIADAINAGNLDAGVMIHEELLYYPQLGLKCVADLGAEWCQRHDLPLPVGLNVIRRSLGTASMERICSGIRQSLEFSLAHSSEALSRVRRMGRGEAGQCTEKFVSMFANSDSVRMPADVREALNVLLCQVVDLGMSSEMPQLTIIEGMIPERIHAHKQVG